MFLFSFEFFFYKRNSLEFLLFIINNLQKSCYWNEKFYNYNQILIFIAIFLVPNYLNILILFCYYIIFFHNKFNEKRKNKIKYIKVVLKRSQWRFHQKKYFFINILY